MQGRLSRSAARQELGRNGNRLDQNGSYVLDGDGRPASIEPAASSVMSHRQVNITPEQLPAMLAGLGHPVQWRVDPDAAQGLAWLVVKLGPLVVPLGLGIEDIQAVIKALAAAWADLAAAATPVADGDCEDLLRASVDAVADRPLLTIFEECDDVHEDTWDANEALEPRHIIRYPEPEPAA
jgi:hypothetical protein